MTCLDCFSDTNYIYTTHSICVNIGIDFDLIEVHAFVVWSIISDDTECEYGSKFRLLHRLPENCFPVTANRTKSNNRGTCLIIHFVAFRLS